MSKINRNELCTVSKTCSKYITNKKNCLLKPQVKGHTFPGKKVAGKVSFSKYEMPIIFQASVTTSQDNFFKIP